MTTDEEIVAALEGRRSVSREAADEAIRNAFRGDPTAVQRAHTNAVLEALGDTPVRTAAEGELPLQKRGDFGEATAIWAAKEAAAVSIKSLAEALMRADGSKGIYLAEGEAKEIASEAYSQAATRSPYEEVRQQHVKEFVTKMAERLTRPALREAKKPTRAAQAAPAGLTKKVTISRMTGQPITHYS